MNIFDWLTENGYKYTWNFKLADRTPEIIAFSSREVVVLEIKAVDIEKSVSKLAEYTEYVNKVFLIIPEKTATTLSENTKNLLKARGIGLIKTNGTVEVLIQARQFSPKNKELIEALKERVIDEQYLTPSGIKNKIIEILRKHRDGLPISYIAKISGLHRQTLAKYLNQLRGSGTIRIRNLGTLKLCYLNEKVGSALRV